MRLPPITRGAKYSVVFLFVLSFLLAGASLWQASREVNQVRRTVAQLRMSVQAQCRFDADLGAAPITVSPATGKPSRLGLAIIGDSRAAWRGLGCPGRLAPPSPSFRHWALYFHLPAD